LPAVTVSIGPITTLTLEAHGIEPTCEARPHTIDGLVAAVLTGLAQS
jgi:uroporphyrinogen III methyltransferase/synthase